MAAPGTAEDFVKWQKQQVGIKESPPGSNRQRYGELFGWNGVAWCAEEEWVGLNHLHVPIVKTASAHLMLAWFEQQHRLITRFADIRPGDIIGWNFDPRANVIPNIEHVSAAVDVPHGTYVTHIGGNTSASAGSGSQDNGGMVAEKAYPSGFFVAAGRPAFTRSEKPKKSGRLPRHEIHRGDKGHDVRLWQQILNHEHLHVDVDGQFGHHTEEATRALQKTHDWKPDGTVDIKAIHAMEQRILGRK